MRNRSLGVWMWQQDEWRWTWGREEFIVKELGQCYKQKIGKKVKQMVVTSMKTKLF